MTDRELMQQALEALNHVNVQDRVQIITALRERLAQPEREPVAWMWKDGTITSDPDRADGTWTPLYTAPPRREWVGLTDEAIWLEYQRFWPFHPAEEPTLAKDIAKFAKAIEAKLKEKNT